MGLTIIDMNGPPEARSMAVFLCDICNDPILGPRAGNVVWLREHPPSDQKRHRVFGFASVHKGACDDAWTARARREHPEAVEQWDDIADVAGQVLFHAQHDLDPEPGVEYVAPQPSQWRR